MRTVRRLDRLPEYVHARLEKAAAEEARANGRKILNLSVGSPDVPPSPRYLDALAGFIREENTHRYPGYGGTREFKDAIRTWHKRRFGVELAEDEALVLLGAKDGVAHLPLALANDGEEVLVPDPGYPGFADTALLAGATPVPYRTLGEIASKLTDKTAFVWLNFPSNPTGAVATLDELRPVVELAKKRNVPLVHDNAYAEITFNDYVAPSILEVENAKDICIELGSFSKTFSFAGYRMGWLVGNSAIVAALEKVKSQTDSGMALPLQRLGAYTLTNQDTVWHAAMLATYKEQRDTIAEKLTRLGLMFEKPLGSLYLWAKIPDSAKDSESYCMALLRGKQVLVAPGSAFGARGERFVRVSISADTSNIDAYF